MGTFRSNLPLGTSDPTVFVEGNVPNLDEALNSQNPTWADRFGVNRLTLSGHGAKFDNQLASQSSQFAGFMDSSSETFQMFLDSSGYSGWETQYAAGIVLNSHNQGFTRCEPDGTACMFYTPLGTTPLPYTTTGDWASESALFVARSTNDVLRQDLAGPGGGNLIGLSDGKTVQQAIEKIEGSINEPDIRPPSTTETPSYPSQSGVKPSLINIKIFTESDRSAAKLDPSDSVFYRLPQIVKYPDGVLGVFAAETHGGYEDIGQSATQRAIIVAKRSRDNGQNWDSIRVPIVDFGSNFQNTEVCSIYNYVDGRTYLFFTSCKGLTGWGHSQAGTTDPELSSQIYVTSCEGYSYESFDTPVNLTDLLKAETDAFIWTSPCQGVVFPDGRMAIVISTVDDTSANVDSYFVEFNKYIPSTRKLIAKSPDTGGEVGLFLQSDGSVIALARSYGTPGGGGTQKIYKSKFDFSYWINISNVSTSDIKGDLVRISNGINGLPIWAITACNGPTDTGDGRSHYRVWTSPNLVEWSKTQVVGIHDDAVAYISSIPGGDGDGVLSATEASGYETIWFTGYSIAHLMGMDFSKMPHGLRSSLRPQTGALIQSGALRNREVFFSQDRNAISIASNGREHVLRVLGIETSTTLRFNSSFTQLFPSAENLDVIEIIEGSHVLNGIQGGYIGQRVSIISISGSAFVDLSHVSQDVESGSDKFHFDLDGNKNKIRVQYGQSSMVVATKTTAGWFFEVSANE